MRFASRTSKKIVYQNVLLSGSRRKSILAAGLMLITLLASCSLKASHIVGGEITYTCLGANYYSIEVTLYRDDCASYAAIMPDSANIKVDEIGGNTVGTYTAGKGPSSFIQPQPGCGTATPDVCLEKASYVVDSVYLPTSPTGYVAYHWQCCRNSDVTNIVDPRQVGITLPAYIYNSSGCNSSPSFSSYPPVLISHSASLAIPAGATAPIGDSLYHEFSAPFTSKSANLPHSPPFASVPFAAPHSGSYPVPSSPALQVSPGTGMISGNISALGKFSVAMSVSQYRNGLLIGRIRRDYQFIVEHPWKVFASISSKTDATCDEHNGTASASAVGGQSPYSYQWSDAQTGQTATGLAPGTHSVVVSDANGCTDTIVFTIDAPDALEVVLDSLTNASCQSSANGFVEVSARGGVPPYTYHWSNGGHTKHISNLKSGSYTIDITDAVGCSTTKTYTISEPSTFEVEVDSLHHVQCHGGADGAVFLRPLNGHRIKKITSSAGQAGANSLRKLSAGHYRIYLENENGCTTSAEFEIQEPTKPILRFSKLEHETCINPYGEVELEISGGTPPYEVQWEDGYASTYRDALLPGKYSIKITDGNGCSFDTLVVIRPQEVKFDVEVNPLGCDHPYAAEIVVEVEGATRPWKIMADDIEIYNGKAFLDPGIYHVTLTDAEGCTWVRSVAVDEKPKEMILPNAFTPNGDGLNDHFEIKGNTMCLPNPRMEIYNRWGDKVFETERPLEVFWDGMSGGQPAKAGVYLYVLSSDKKSHKGYVHIIK